VSGVEGLGGEGGGGREKGGGVGGRRNLRLGAVGGVVGKKGETLKTGTGRSLESKKGGGGY